MLSAEVKAWNQVIFETLYSPDAAGSPVYLDLDDETAELLSSHPLLKGAASLNDLIQAVKRSLRTDLRKTEMFLDYEQATHIWITDVVAKRDTDEPPPMLALLAVTVLAAEKMGSDGGKGNAYYVHLNSILGIEDKHQAEGIEESYRKVILYLWQALGTFLVEKGGYHGVPTAYSLSTTYVGAAVSQALVRDFDRKKLPRMFDYLRLTPGDAMTTGDMAGLFQAWLAHEDNGISQSLKNLWERGAKDEISQVICNELTKWDGTVPANQRLDADGVLHGMLASKAKLVAHFTTSLGIRKFTSSFAISISANELEGQSFSVNGIEDKKFGFSKRSNSLAECVDGFEFNPGSLLTSILEITSTSGKTWRRLPKNIVMFALDEDSGLWLEVDKASLGQRMCVFARLDSTAWSKLPTFLELNARPGFIFDSKTKNVPLGWGILTDVEIITVDINETVHQDLKCLVPVSGSQIVITDGLRLPTTGSLRFWHRDYAPRIEGISQNSKALRLDIKAPEWPTNGKMRTVFSRTSNSGFVEIDLREKGLDDGNYKIGLYDGTELLNERDLYIRSSKTPDAVAVHNRQTIAHTRNGNAFEFLTNTAPIKDPHEPIVSGFFANFEIESDSYVKGDFGDLLGWDLDVETDVSPTYLDLIPLDSESCAYTGAHNRKLGFCGENIKYVVGICQGCGDRSIELCKFWLAAPKDGVSTKSLKPVKASHLKASPIQIETNTVVDWHIALDVIQHCISGTYSSLLTSLEKLAAGDITARRIAQEFETLGFIEISRNKVGEEVAWALVASQIIRRGNQIDLLGYWPSSVLNQLHDEGLAESTENGRLSLLTISAANESRLSLAAEKVEGFWFLESTPLDLLLGLPVMSDVISDAPREVLPSLTSVEQFDFIAGKWLDSPSGSPRPGAFKIKGMLGNRYYCATEEDLCNGKAISGSATMVKWLGAKITESNCLAYRERKEILISPLGMQLFGLYARAAVAFSGKNAGLIQSKSNGKRFNNYSDVPVEAAAILASRCTS